MDYQTTKTAPRSIRWHLFQILLVTIIPVGLVGAALFYLHWQAQERERERSQIESVRLLATAVDNALDSTVQRLNIFARQWASGRTSDAEMHARAVEAVAASPDWANMVAFRADGSPAFRAEAPFGTPLPKMTLFAPWRAAVEEGRPVVSDIFTSRSSGDRIVGIGVPVVRDGRVTHVLIADLNLRWFDKLLTSQGAGGIAGIFDRHWKFVARGTEGDRWRGGDPSPPLIEDMKRRPEGIGRYSSLNAMPVYTSWTPSRHGWWVAFATPSAPVDNAFWTHLVVFGLMWAAAAAAGIAFTLRKGRRIAGALVSLEARAEDLAGGRPLSGLALSRVSEVDHALAALGKASETLQAAMQQRNTSLEIEREARAAAEAASRAKDEFLAMLGHELRNPLAAITNAVAIVKSERHTPEQLEFAAGIIDRQSQHLKRLIDDLLDVGRVMTGKILLEREPLDLAASARHVAITLDTAGRLAQRRFEIDAQPAWINGDQTRIEQIVTNLLVNAAAYTPPGGHVRLRVAREGEEALIQVSDDGRGIPPESLPRVFELFYQADATVDRSRGGLGIGLTLVQRLAELHGGWVRAHSAGVGQGATFSVRIPAIAAPAQAQRPLAAAALAPPREILLVEDNADERRSLRVALELQGHRVLEAADGPAALEVLRRHTPSVAILDIGLPGMDGYRLAGLVRAEHRDLFLIALTGYGGAEDESRAREAGFDRHLTKPADTDDLARAIQSARRPFRNASAIRA
jgi:signal transduction histidine kinase/ActR/RegA family two-component response regulator